LAWPSDLTPQHREFVSGTAFSNAPDRSEPKTDRRALQRATEYETAQATRAKKLLL
jgi:hypothetical protein